MQSKQKNKIVAQGFKITHQSPNANIANLTQFHVYISPNSLAVSAKSKQTNKQTNKRSPNPSDLKQ